MTAARGVCPVCSRVVGTYSNGKIVWHLPKEPDGTGGRYCKGRGRDPLPLQAERTIPPPRPRRTVSHKPVREFIPDKRYWNVLLALVDERIERGDLLDDMPPLNAR